LTTNLLRTLEHGEVDTWVRGVIASARRPMAREVAAAVAS
jgi:hypothetical protein